MKIKFLGTWYDIVALIRVGADLTSYHVTYQEEPGLLRSLQMDEREFLNSINLQVKGN